jgi:SAM-dependent methyltransferase
MGLRSRWMRGLSPDAEAAYRTKILESLDAQPVDRLLDVGCDDGAWTDVVRRTLELPPDGVAAVEVVADRARLARSRGFDVRVADLEERWPFEAASFDVVHANHVIEHVKRLDHFVAETIRVLRPGGRAIVCTENLASWRNVASLTLGYQPFSPADVSPRARQHVHVLSLSALRDIFLAHGFSIAGAWGTGYYPFRGRVAARLAEADPRHAHVVGIVARRPEGRGYKLLTVGAALYVLLPFDVIPDFMPIVGHFDDALVVTLVLLCARNRWLARVRRLVARPGRPLSRFAVG